MRTWSGAFTFRMSPLRERGEVDSWPVTYSMNENVAGWDSHRYTSTLAFLWALPLELTLTEQVPYDPGRLNIQDRYTMIRFQ